MTQHGCALQRYIAFSRGRRQTGNPNGKLPIANCVTDPLGADTRWTNASESACWSTWCGLVVCSSGRARARANSFPPIYMPLSSARHSAARGVGNSGSSSGLIDEFRLDHVYWRPGQILVRFPPNRLVVDQTTANRGRQRRWRPTTIAHLSHLARLPTSPPPTHSVCALNYSRGACTVGLQHKIRLLLQLAAASARAGKQKQKLFFRFRCWAGTFVGRSGGLKEGEGYGTRFPPSSLLLVSPSWVNLHTVRRAPLGDGRLDGHFIGTFDYLADLMVCDLCRS